jgi:hypothetical protein
VTDRHALWIDVGLISYRTAVALPVDIHFMSTPIARSGRSAQKERRPKAPFYHFTAGTFSARSGHRRLRRPCPA